MVKEPFKILDPSTVRALQGRLFCKKRVNLYNFKILKLKNNKPICDFKNLDIESVLNLNIENNVFKIFEKIGPKTDARNDRYNTTRPKIQQKRPEWPL